MTEECKEMSCEMMCHVIYILFDKAASEQELRMDSVVQQET